MEESILTTIKRMLGIIEADTAFDEDILVHINSAMMVLNQLGVGPVEVFLVNDATPKWVDFATDVQTYSLVKTYIWLFVKLVFDNNVTGHVLSSLQAQKQEYEWRLTNQVPVPPEVP